MGAKTKHMYILKKRCPAPRGVYDCYLQSCQWIVGAVRPVTVMNKDNAKTFETKLKAEQFRDDNLTGKWTAVKK